MDSRYSKLLKELEIMEKAEYVIMDMIAEIEPKKSKPGNKKKLREYRMSLYYVRREIDKIDRKINGFIVSSYAFSDESDELDQ